MLNYIWLGLIVIGVLVAVVSDVRDLKSDRFQNDTEILVTINLEPSVDFLLTSGQHYPCTIVITSKEYAVAYGVGTPEAGDVIQKGVLTASDDDRGLLTITMDEHTPAAWKERVSFQKNASTLLARVRWESHDQSTGQARISFDPIKFVKMNAVTNDGIIKYAKTAVELAIGLIGIMALWLGIMKIAEQSGLVAQLAGLLKPLTTRLFPDVPPDHPAMGAMIMNIAANMLGLANAATPLGLKAMEELNKLNKKLGTATDAMCTFLVINTSSVQLIPATVIAIRAASGSTNPTEILGPVSVATTVNTIIGVATVKLLAKLPHFRRQLAVEAK